MNSSEPHSFDTELDQKENLMSESHSPVLLERTIAVDDLPDGARRPGSGVVILFDSHDADGRDIPAELSEPEYDELTRSFAGEAWTDSNRNVHTFHGRYLVASVSGGVATLHLASKQRCPIEEWCSGHVMLPTDTFEDQVHWSQAVTLQSFSAKHGGISQTNSVRIGREKSDQGEGYSVQIEFDAFVSPAEIEVLAVELEAAAARLRARVGHLEALNAA